MVFQQGDHDHERYGGQNIHNSLHNDIRLTAVVALDGAVDGADEQVDGGDDDSQHEGESGAACEAGEQVLTCMVGSEYEQRLFDAILRNGVGILVVLK